MTATLSLGTRALVEDEVNRTRTTVLRIGAAKAGMTLKGFIRWILEDFWVPDEERTRDE